MKFQNLNEFVIPLNFRERSRVYVQLWWLIQTFLFNSSPQFMYKWRAFCLGPLELRLAKV